MIKNTKVGYVLLLSIGILSCLQSKKYDILNQSNNIRMKPEDSLSLVSTLDTSSIIKSHIKHCRKNNVTYFSEVWLEYKLNDDKSWSLVKVDEPYTYKLDDLLNFTKFYFGRYNFVAPDDKYLYFTVDMVYHLEENEFSFEINYIYNLKNISIFNYKRSPE